MSPPAITPISLPVQGMTCAACVRRVEKALGSVKGVASVSVNLATERATVVADASLLPQLRTAARDAGYDLLLPEATTGGQRAPADATADLRRDLILALMFSVPVMAVSMTGIYAPPSVHGVPVIPTLLFLLTLPVMLFPGRRFFTASLAALRHRAADMNTLVAVGTGTAFLYSTIAAFAPGLLSLSLPPPLYFDTSAAIITLIVLGKWLERSAKRRAAAALRDLAALQPATACVRRDGLLVDVPIETIHVDDAVIVRPGARVPVDGIIVAGRSSVDESMISGESIPVSRDTGDAVVTGTLNIDGLLEIRATAVGEGTVLARILTMVEQAQGSKAPIERLADRIAGVFVPVVILIAVATLVLWLTLGGAPLSLALIHAVAVLVIACPCALGLATPAAIIVGTGVGARHGILIRNAESLERAHRTSVVVFDKTGTLTTGAPSVAAQRTAPGFDPDRILAQVAAVERLLGHPIGDAVVVAARAKQLPLPDASSFAAIPGRGVSALVDGRTVLAGSAAFFHDQGVDAGPLADDGATLQEQGNSLLFAAVDGRPAALFGIMDTVRDSAPTAVAELRALGIEPVLLTGDHAAAARAVAARAGITTVIAGVRPDEKAWHVASLQGPGKQVAMIGDGINDAPALARADVGIAMGTGTDIAMETADITLVHGDLRAVATALRLSRRTVRTIRQNLFWAFVYNSVGIPLAALGLLNPMIAASAMAFSSVSVLGNSLRLRRFTP